MITFAQLKQIVPTISDKADVFIPYLNDTMAEYDIASVRQRAAFIAQLAHESGAFKYTVEIASGSAYEGREDLGNLYTGDGKKFKGRGLLQVTGRANYGKVSKALGQDFVANPELLAAPQYAVRSAGWFWQNIKGNGLMALPEDWRSKTKKYSPFQYLTYRINGGLNGYSERARYFLRGLTVLGTS